MWQPAFVVFVLTAPLLLTRAWKVAVLVGVIWAITTAIYAWIVRTSPVPRIELDATTGRAKIGKYEQSLSTVCYVSTTAASNTAGLEFTLRDVGARETDFSSASASTPAERSRIAKIINEFLEAHRDTSRADPYRETAGESYVDAFEGPEEKAIEDEAGGGEEDRQSRWADAWDAESTASRKCFFCGMRNGDSGPLQLWAKRSGALELLFIPRCRRCRRIHDLNKRFIPPLGIVGGLIGGFAIVSFTGFVPAIVATPLGAFLVGYLLTMPRLYGSKDRGAWRQIPELRRALQDGWDIRVRRAIV